MARRQAAAPFAPAARPRSTPRWRAGCSSSRSRPGGDYADLYFEYRAGADYVYEDEQVKSVGRGITLGLGVRVHQGRRHRLRLLRGARPGRRWPTRRAPRRRSRRRASRRRRSTIARCTMPDFYPVRGAVARDAGAGEARAACVAAIARRARVDPRIVKVSCIVRRGAQGDPVVTSDGRLARDRQPLHALRRARDRRGRRQAAGAARAAAAGASAWSTSTRHPPEAHGARSGARGASRCSTPSTRRPARWRSCSAPGDSGILLHEAVGHGLEADFNRKETSNYSGQLGKRVASRAVHRRRRRHHRAHRAAPSTSTTKATPAQKNVLIENGILRALHARPAVARSTSASSRRATAGASRSATMPLPRMTNTLAARRPARSRGDHQLGQARRLRQALLRRPGQHLERRLRLLADRELPHRGRQADRAAQGREPDRQRPRRAAPRSTCSATTSSSPTASGPAARTASRCPSASALRPSRSPRSPSEGPRHERMTTTERSSRSCRESRSARCELAKQAGADAAEVLVQRRRRADGEGAPRRAGARAGGRRRARSGCACSAIGARR